MNHEEYQEEIRSLRQQLSAKEELLSYTRQYADNLLGQINEYVNDLQTVQSKLLQHNKNLRSSISCASHVLEVVMTPKRDFREKYPHSFIFSKPRDIIGGDFFWMYQVEGVNFLAVADCTGHGVSGAMLSMMCGMMLKQIIVEQEVYDPSKILKLLDKHVNERSTGNYDDDTGFYAYNSVSDFAMDMLIAVHDERREELHISSAHMPYFVCKGDQTKRYKGSRHSVGVSGRTRKKSFDYQTFSLKEGLSFYFFSDGFSDQKTAKRKVKLGRAKFQHFIEANTANPFLDQ